MQNEADPGRANFFSASVFRSAPGGITLNNATDLTYSYAYHIYATAKRLALWS